MAGAGFEKEIASLSVNRTDWEKTYFVEKTPKDNFDYMADSSVDNKVLAGALDTNDNFETVVAGDMADYDFARVDSHGNQSESRASFAPRIHLSSDCMGFYSNTWANISSANFSITDYEAMNGKVTYEGFPSQCQNGGDFV